MLVPHQRRDDLVRRVGRRQSVLEGMPQAAERVVRRRPQAVLVKGLDHGRREVGLLVTVAREAFRLRARLPAIFQRQNGVQLVLMFRMIIIWKDCGSSLTRVLQK